VECEAIQYRIDASIVMGYKCTEMFPFVLQSCISLAREPIKVPQYVRHIFCFTVSCSSNTASLDVVDQRRASDKVNIA
jgi:hypothetical protein